MERERNNAEVVVEEKNIPTTEEEAKEKNRNLAFIKINKALCTTKESKIEGRSKYNIMTLPKGTIVGDTDLSFAKINPIVMVEDKYSKHMMTAIYDKDKMKDNNVSVFVQEEGQGKYLQVDVDALHDAVANQNYYEEQKKNKEVEKGVTAETAEKTVDKSVEQETSKMEPLNASNLKKDQEQEIEA